MKYCADCVWMGETPNKDGLFKCTNCASGYDAVSARMQACRSFTEAFNSRRSESQREGFMGISRSHGYYIVTVVTTILGIEDQASYLSNFAYFRDQMMPLIIGGEEWLLDYDCYGPDIADKIKNAPNALEVAQKLFDNYIKPFNTYFEENMFDDALVIYQTMFSELKKEYCPDSSGKKLGRSL